MMAKSVISILEGTQQPPKHRDIKLISLSFKPEGGILFSFIVTPSWHFTKVYMHMSWAGIYGIPGILEKNLTALVAVVDADTSVGERDNV